MRTGPEGQLAALRRELVRNVNRQAGRWLILPFVKPTWALIGYRVPRALHLALGRRGAVLVTPLATVLSWISGCEISYKANLGPGLRVLHPSLSVVVSAHCTAGPGLILVGGNCIGGPAVLGANVVLGANAVVLGPVTVGDRVRVGAGAVVVDDIPADAVAVGVPAHPVGSVRM